MAGRAHMTLRKFICDTLGGASVPIALSIAPIVTGAGAAIDFGRVVIASSQLQSAVDNAALTATSMSGNLQERKTAADNALSAALQGLTAATYLAQNPDGSYTYTASYPMLTKFTPFIEPSVTIARAATAKSGTPGTPGTPGSDGRSDDACIFSMGEDLNVDTETLTFNGSPNVKLTGCSLRSNKSMKCNGHDTGASASYAVGSITNCPNPFPNEPVYPDIYSYLKDGIERQCGTNAAGAALTVNGALPTAGPNVIYVSRVGYTEIHICGNLTLAGKGALRANAALSSQPGEDTVIVIENGGLVMGDQSDVAAKRVTFVLAGLAEGVTGSPTVQWPNGAGKAATLRVSSSTYDDNPWKGHAIYQPATVNVDQDWKPGSNVVVDGIVYLPRARLTVSGVVGYGAGNCSKLVVGELTLNGSVDLKQDATSCASQKVMQYYVAPIAGTPGTPGLSSYLTR